MLRAIVYSGLLMAAPAAFLMSAPATGQSNGQRCEDTAAKQQRRSMFGNILGSAGQSLLGRSGVGSQILSVALPATSYLTDELLKMLDCKEQQQAAKATDQAIRGGVGTEVAWTSDSRPNVSGRSTVTAEEKLADGGQCVTVTDVVIVDGEETTVPKKMCRAKGASAYAKV